MSPKEDRAVGCLMGLAVGDALGTTLEFQRPGTFTPIIDMVGGGPFNLQPGQWTDDTSMALCLTESLLENGWDPADQMARYLRWYEEGENSSTGTCFDIGNTVRSALTRFKETSDPFSGSTDPQSAGNGSLMRLAPIPLYYHQNSSEALEKAVDMSRTTHGARTCLDACRYATALIIELLKGTDPQDALEHAAQTPDLCPEIEEIAQGSFREKNPPSIRGTGYVVQSLEAALWAFWNSDTFRQGALLAVNLGDDADTTGAIYGQIAGAHYGSQGIPKGWKDLVYEASRIKTLALNLIHARSSGK